MWTEWIPAIMLALGFGLLVCIGVYFFRGQR